MTTSLYHGLHHLPQLRTLNLSCALAQQGGRGTRLARIACYVCLPVSHRAAQSAERQADSVCVCVPPLRSRPETRHNFLRSSNGDLAAFLAGLHHLPRLQELNLAMSSLRAEGVSALVQELHVLTQLQTLNLWCALERRVAWRSASTHRMWVCRVHVCLSVRNFTRQAGDDEADRLSSPRPHLLRPQR